MERVFREFDQCAQNMLTVRTQKVFFTTSNKIDLVKRIRIIQIVFVEYHIQVIPRERRCWRRGRWRVNNILEVEQGFFTNGSARILVDRQEFGVATRYRMEREIDLCT